MLPRVDLVIAGHRSWGHGMAVSDKRRGVHIDGKRLLLRRVGMRSCVRHGVWRRIVKALVMRLLLPQKLLV